jgi:hypothetical protein
MRRDIRRVLGMATGCVLAALAHSGSPSQPAQPDPVVFHQEIVRKPDVYIEAFVTGYNTVATQTDGTPCIGAAGTYICGRNELDDGKTCVRVIRNGPRVGAEPRPASGPL